MWISFFFIHSFFISFYIGIRSSYRIPLYGYQVNLIAKISLTLLIHHVKHHDSFKLNQPMITPICRYPSPLDTTAIQILHKSNTGKVLRYHSYCLHCDHTLCINHLIITPVCRYPQPFDTTEYCIIGHIRPHILPLYRCCIIQYIRRHPLLLYRCCIHWISINFSKFTNMFCLNNP